MFTDFCLCTKILTDNSCVCVCVYFISSRNSKLLHYKILPRKEGKHRHFRLKNIH